MSQTEYTVEPCNLCDRPFNYRAGGKIDCDDCAKKIKYGRAEWVEQDIMTQLTNTISHLKAIGVDLDQPSGRYEVSDLDALNNPEGKPTIVKFENKFGKLHLTFESESVKLQYKIKHENNESTLVDFYWKPDPEWEKVWGQREKWSTERFQRIRDMNEDIRAYLENIATEAHKISA